uniref:Uncharacterized protein n=1 Tax=Ditylenchus dipsaci TaxID=166011 RepID=A0A915ERT7_9BILA
MAYSDTQIVNRLRELEAEISMQVGQAGSASLPQDPQLSELMARILTSRFPGADLQIVVSSSRKTTTTKQYYETETPGMVGLETDQLRELQSKLMEKISTSPSFDARASGKAASRSETAGNGHTNGHASTQPEGSAANGASVQHKESSEEAFANGDGSQVVSKKMTRVVTTSQSSVSGADESFDRSIGQGHEIYGQNGSSATAGGSKWSVPVQQNQDPRGAVLSDHMAQQQKQQPGQGKITDFPFQLCTSIVADITQEETESISSTTSLGSVRDRIAIFESLKDTTQHQPPPSNSTRTSKSSSPKSVQEHVLGGSHAQPQEPQPQEYDQEGGQPSPVLDDEKKKIN